MVVFGDGPLIGDPSSVVFAALAYEADALRSIWQMTSVGDMHAFDGMDAWQFGPFE
jgi:hypothetical protein